MGKRKTVPTEHITLAIPVEYAQILRQQSIAECGSTSKAWAYVRDAVREYLERRGRLQPAPSPQRAMAYVIPPAIKADKQ